MVALGPGVLKIGDTDAALTDYSCLVTSLTLTVSASTSDSTFKLCGTEVPGVTDLTGELGGTLDQDIDQVGGLFEYASKNTGQVKSFLFEPSTSAGLSASGQILMMAMSFGGDAYGEELTSDVAWSTVGDIEYERTAGGAGWTQRMGKIAATSAPAATGAVAGTPGHYTPAGAATPPTVAALASVTASPTTAWTTGQYVPTGAGHAYWNGTAYVAGDAP